MALNPEQQDIIKTNLKRMDRMVRGFERGEGLEAQGLRPHELRQAYQYATQQAEQAIQLAKAGRLTPRQGNRGLPQAGGGGSRIVGDERNAPRPAEATFQHPVFREQLRQRLRRQRIGGIV